MKRTGHCLCGAVTFTAEVEPHYHACHCTMCRRWSGGPFLGTMCGPEVSFEGREITRYQSSKIAERGFCAACGTHLFYYSIPGQVYVMPAGLFDDQQGLDLAGEIYVDEKPQGYAFTGDHPRLTGEEFVASITGAAND